MKLFNNDKAFFQHPGMMIFIAFVAGLVAAYLWINYINFPNPFCPK